MPVLVWRIAAWPLIKIRFAGMSHWTLTQGWGLRTTMKGQPATTKLSPMVATGWPLTSTRLLVEITVTCPEWGQIAVAPTWYKRSGTKYPSASFLSLLDFQGTLVNLNGIAAQLYTCTLAVFNFYFVVVDAN